MAKIEVSDLYIGVNGMAVSLRDKKIHNGSNWKNINPGSGIYQGGNWYVLKTPAFDWKANLAKYNDEAWVRYTPSAYPGDCKRIFYVKDNVLHLLTDTFATSISADFEYVNTIDIIEYAPNRFYILYINDSFSDIDVVSVDLIVNQLRINWHKKIEHSLLTDYEIYNVNVATAENGDILFYYQDDSTSCFAKLMVAGDQVNISPVIRGDETGDMKHENFFAKTSTILKIRVLNDIAYADICRFWGSALAYTPAEILVDGRPFNESYTTKLTEYHSFDLLDVRENTGLTIIKNKNSGQRFFATVKIAGNTVVMTTVSATSESSIPSYGSFVGIDNVFYKYNGSSLTPVIDLNNLS